MKLNKSISVNQNNLTRGSLSVSQNKSSYREKLSTIKDDSCAKITVRDMGNGYTEIIRK
jgi:hypothetical protein